MEAIKDTLQTVFQDLTLKKKVGDKEIPDGWLKKALTKKELEHIKFNYFKKGILGLSVDCSSWHYKFNLDKEKLLAKLKKYSKDLKDIHYRIGEVK